MSVYQWVAGMKWTLGSRSAGVQVGGAVVHRHNWQKGKHKWSRSCGGGAIGAELYVESFLCVHNIKKDLVLRWELKVLLSWCNSNIYRFLEKKIYLLPGEFRRGTVLPPDNQSCSERTTFLPVGPNLHLFQRLWLGRVFSQSACFLFLFAFDISGPSVPLPHNRDATLDKKKMKICWVSFICFWLGSCPWIFLLKLILNSTQNAKSSLRLLLFPLLRLFGCLTEMFDLRTVSLESQGVGASRGNDFGTKWSLFLL